MGAAELRLEGPEGRDEVVPPGWEGLSHPPDHHSVNHHHLPGGRLLGGWGRLRRWAGGPPGLLKPSGLCKWALGGLPRSLDAVVDSGGDAALCTPATPVAASANQEASVALEAAAEDPGE